MQNNNGVIAFTDSNHIIIDMRTILFLHGWGGAGGSFAPVAKYFSNFYNTLSPDMPCPPADIWTLDDYVSYIEDILQKNSVTRCHIVAHSFGARVAVLLAARNPGLTDKMVVTGGAGLKPRFNLCVWLKIKLYKVFKLGAGSRDYRELTANGKTTFQNIVTRDLAPEIAALTVPTLLIYGGRDKATPPYMAAAWAKLCRTAEYKIYPKYGHFAYLDNLPAFIHDVQEFLCE
jgi:pimeloyl-ACP methyl ester carboxylesterase